MEELLAESKIELLKEGSVISGTIMEIRPTEVVIDFGGKAEGGPSPPMNSLTSGSLRSAPISRYTWNAWKIGTETLNSPSTRPSRKRTGKRSSIPVRKAP